MTLNSVSRDCRKQAIISGMGKATNFNLAGVFTGPSEQKPIKNFGEEGAWA